MRARWASGCHPFWATEVVRVIRHAACPAVPWKNRLGETRELWRQNDAAGEMLARLSIATIAGTQEFSCFPGVDRIIMALSGAAVTLSVDGKTHALMPAAPFAFAGEARVTSNVRGTAQDLNLMCSRRHFRPLMTVNRVVAGETISAQGEADHTLVMALQPALLGGTEPLALAANDVVVLEPGQHLQALAEARLAVMAVLPATRIG